MAHLHERFWTIRTNVTDQWQLPRPLHNDYKKNCCCCCCCCVAVLQQERTRHLKRFIIVKVARSYRIATYMLFCGKYKYVWCKYACICIALSYRFCATTLIYRYCLMWRIRLENGKGKLSKRDSHEKSKVENKHKIVVEETWFVSSFSYLFLSWFFLFENILRQFFSTLRCLK